MVYYPGGKLYSNQKPTNIHQTRWERRTKGDYFITWPSGRKERMVIDGDVMNAYRSLMDLAH